MNLTLLSDLEQLRALLITQRPVELDMQLDPIDLPFLGFAFGAIFGVDIRMLKPSGDALERQAFTLGIHRDGYRCACPQRGK